MFPFLKIILVLRKFKLSWRNEGCIKKYWKCAETSWKLTYLDSKWLKVGSWMPSSTMAPTYSVSFVLSVSGHLSGHLTFLLCFSLSTFIYYFIYYYLLRFPQLPGIVSQCLKYKFLEKKYIYLISFVWVADQQYYNITNMPISINCFRREFG